MTILLFSNRILLCSTKWLGIQRASYLSPRTAKIKGVYIHTPRKCSFLVWFSKSGSLCSPGYPGTHSVDQVGLQLRDLSAFWVPSLPDWENILLTEFHCRTMCKGKDNTEKKRAQKGGREPANLSKRWKSRTEQSRMERSNFRENVSSTLCKRAWWSDFVNAHTFSEGYKDNSRQLKRQSLKRY